MNPALHRLQGIRVVFQQSLFGGIMGKGPGCLQSRIVSSLLGNLETRLGQETS